MDIKKMIIYTMMYYLVVKKSEIMKITGRWTVLEAIQLVSEVTNT